MQFALIRGEVMLIFFPPPKIFSGGDGLVFSALDQRKERGKEGEGAAQGPGPELPKGKLRKVIKEENLSLIHI